MIQEIYNTAEVFAGTLSDAEKTSLMSLCAAANAELEGKLKVGVAPADCQSAFICAAAWNALAGFLIAKSGERVASFSAGNVSVTEQSPVERNLAAEALREQAERTMAPYLRDNGFVFSGVVG